MKSFFKHLRKRGQTGQSILILAIGFIALLGFVGIVTDVSVLFIRYSTMRRAIDAAAIAAAGQMRRVVDETPDDGVADGEATSVANLNLAARQFIEVYGLDPTNVVVETCRAQQVPRDASGNAYDKDPTDVSAQPLYITVPDDPLNPGGSSHSEINPLADPDVIARYRELCTDDELKLVRVTAQIDAPTIFLRLLGYPTVTLTESAVSQTAVIDVVLIFDVSESMLNETNYDDWDNIHQPNLTTSNPDDYTVEKQGVRYMPPFIDWQDYSAFDLINSSTEHDLNGRIDPLRSSAAGTIDPILNDKLWPFEPDGSGGWQTYNTALPVSPTGREQPREFCQVRAYIPSAVNEGQSPVSGWLLNEYSGYFGPSYVDHLYTDSGNPQFSGFVPLYNYYGCCNDPNGVVDSNGNWDFSDLVCQPFGAARDAAEAFLGRLDFLRGDRVAFVTFDRTANPVDPDGAGPQATMIETERDLYDSSGTTLIRKGAVETLRSIVGVRAEPTTYRDNNNDGLWDHLVDGVGHYTTPRTYQEFLTDPNATIGDIVLSPVPFACPFDKAALPPPYVGPKAMYYLDGTPRNYYDPILEDVVTVPTWYSGSDPAKQSYEFDASCGGTNMGGALQMGSRTLYNEGRREGAVWIMVLLSDGAAGASNPISRIGTDTTITEPNVYNQSATASSDPGVPSSVYAPVDGIGGPITAANGGAGYGAYGLCPYGTDNLSDTVRDPGPTEISRSYNFPLCSDLHPEYRHYCGTIAEMPDAALNDFNAGDPESWNCINYYNVDDYARDWADWVGISELPGAASGGTSGRIGDQLLPTIFTIGFGLNYDINTTVSCGSGTDAATYRCIRGIPSAGDAIPAGDTSLLQRTRNSDYLGEELLRYISDVGDNFQIDNDYWQSDMGSRIQNEIDLTSSAPEWGQRGACEAAYTGAVNGNGQFYDPKPPRQSCGNYFVAPTGKELEQVFNEIASRMFTRLSQ